MTKIKRYLKREDGLMIIQRLKTEPDFWYELIKTPIAEKIFRNKARSLSINFKEPMFFYDDMVNDMWIHLSENNWARLDRIKEPERFWGWFQTAVNYHFGFKPGDKAGGTVYTHGGTTEPVDSIDQDSTEKTKSKTVQLPDYTNPERIAIANDGREQYKRILDIMKSSSKKGLPLKAEVLERIDLLEEERDSIVIDFIKRGIFPGPVKESYTSEELAPLRNNLNNNIYSRGRQALNEISLRLGFDIRYEIKSKTTGNENNIQ